MIAVIAELLPATPYQWVGFDRLAIESY